MKREPSTVARSLRAVSLVITLVSLVAVASIAYSGFADISGVLGVVGQNPGSSGVATKTVTQGTSTTVYLNVTVPNDGLYPLTIGLSCQPSGGITQVTCITAGVTIPPGGQQILHFAVTVPSSAAPNIHANATLAVALEPFASFSIVIDLGRLVSRGA